MKRSLRLRSKRFRGVFRFPRCFRFFFPCSDLTLCVNLLLTHSATLEAEPSPSRCYGYGDPSHPLCFARFEGDMRHFRCHRNSSFLQCEFKSFYILPNTAHSGLNSPSTRCQTISGFIHWIIYKLFVIFRIKSVTQTRECNRTSLWFESQLKQH